MTCSVATPSNGKLITIVIPVYNRERLLVRTLDSIAVQDTGRINLIDRWKPPRGGAMVPGP